MSQSDEAVSEISAPYKNDISPYDLLDYQRRISYLLRFYATDCDATSDGNGGAIINNISFDNADIEKVVRKLSSMMESEANK